MAAVHYMTGSWLVWSTIHLHLEEAKAHVSLQHEEELFLYRVIQVWMTYMRICHCLFLIILDQIWC